MKNKAFNAIFIVLILVMQISFDTSAQIQKDTFETSEGTLEVFHVGHASLYFTFNEKVIHVDPFGKMGDYTQMPKADLILITHAHGDHLDAETIETISTKETKLVMNPASYETLNKGHVMKNGDEMNILDLPIKAVPSYNMVHKRDNGEFYHPKGRDNGYVIEFANKRIYIAGDTENIPEMESLQNIDIAFLPMNVPYTMTPEMAKKAALMVNPAVLFPYHYKMGGTDTMKFAKIMKDVPEIDVRFRE